MAQGLDPETGADDGESRGRSEAEPAAYGPATRDVYDELGDLLDEYFDGTGDPFDGVVTY
jgi:hypothetical protein